MKKGLLLMLTAVLCFCLVACGGKQTPAEVFDEVVNKIQEVENIGSIRKELKEKEKISEALKELGLYDSETVCQIDKAFIEEYLQTHTAEEFFTNIDLIYTYLDQLSWHLDEESIFKKVKTITTTAVEVAAIPLITIERSQAGTPGFYTEHTEKYPPLTTWEESGRFYDHSGQNGHTQTKTCSIEYTYYGDFAIRHQQGYSYQKGRYEWVNGRFYDELPSWKSYNDYSFYYKGWWVLDSEEGSEAQIWNEINKLKIFELGNATFIIFDSMEQHDGKVLWKLQELQ